MEFIPNIVGQRYELLERIKEGGNGIIYKGIDIFTGEAVAIKRPIYPSLVKEFKKEVRILKTLAGIPGIPVVYWNGFHGKTYYLVMQLLGKDLARKYYCNCTLDYSLYVVRELLTILQGIHDKGYLHLDLKLENVIVDDDDSSVLYLVDFGAARTFLDKNGEHIKFDTNVEELKTTMAFASVNLLCHCTPSRKDDLIMLGYLLLDLLNMIPWNYEKTSYGAHIESRLQLTEGGNSDRFPKQFIEYMMYCENLDFDEKPDYDYLRDCLCAMSDKELDNKESLPSVESNVGMKNKINRSALRRA